MKRPEPRNSDRPLFSPALMK